MIESIILFIIMLLIVNLISQAITYFAKVPRINVYFEFVNVVTLLLATGLALYLLGFLQGNDTIIYKN